MERQLLLLEAPKDWRLDARTREVGRRGVASARAALRDALADRQGLDHHDGHQPGGDDHRSAA